MAREVFRAIAGNIATVMRGQTAEHVQEMAVPVIAHRIAIDPQARFSGVTAASIVEEIVRAVPAPA